MNKNFKYRLITSLLCFIIFTCSLGAFTTVSSGRVYAEKDKKEMNNEQAREQAPSIESLSGIVMNIDTGTIIYEKDAYKKHYPASITKVMTALIAIEKGDMNSTVTLSDAAVDNTPRDSSNIALSYGEKLTLKNALYGMLLSSANEAAYAIAEHIGGSLPAFCDMMNSKAAELGCKNTHFVNASGLHDKDHYTCAYDMALIGCAAYKLTDFRAISSTLTYTIPPTNLNTERVLWHGDDMLFSSSEYYNQYVTCGKTGYTDEANGTLITFAEKDGQRLVCVVMDVVPSSKTFTDTTKLLDFCFNNYHYIKPLEHFSFSKLENDSSVLQNYYSSLPHQLPNLSTDTDYSLYVRTYINPDNIDRNIVLFSATDSEIVGRIELSFEGEKLGEVDIINNDFISPVPSELTTEDTSSSKGGFKFHFYYVIIFVIIVVLVLIFVEIHMIQKRERQRKRIHSYPYKKASGTNKKKNAEGTASQDEQTHKKKTHSKSTHANKTHSKTGTSGERIDHLAANSSHVNKTHSKSSTASERIDHLAANSSHVNKTHSKSATTGERIDHLAAIHTHGDSMYGDHKKKKTHSDHAQNDHTKVKRSKTAAINHSETAPAGEQNEAKESAPKNVLGSIYSDFDNF